MDVTLSGLIAQEGAISAYVTVYGIFAAYVFLGVAAFFAIIFPVLQMFRDFKKALFVIAGVAVLLLLFMLCYSMSVAEAYTTSVGDTTATAGQMKLVEALLYLLYIVLGLGVFSVLVSPFLKYLK